MTEITIYLNFCPVCDLPFWNSPQKHHIKFKQHRGRLTITICPTCHKRLHSDRKFRPYAQEKIHSTLRKKGIGENQL